MEDILKASSKKLERLSSKSLDAVRSAKDYTIQHSDDVLDDMSQVWTKLQAGKLHADGRVVAANLQAARIVAELTTAYALIPNLIDSAYRLEYQRLKDSQYLAAYRKRVGSGERVEFRHELLSFLPIYLLVGSAIEPDEDIEIPVDDLVMAKDYVASLSDSRARKLHSDIFKS